MSSFSQRYCRTMEIVARCVAGVAGLILVAQVLSLTYSATRGLLNVLGVWTASGQAVWLTELVTAALLPLGLLCAAVALRAGAHQGIDALTSRMPRRVEAAIPVVVNVSIAVFGVLFAIVGADHVLWAARDGGTLSSVPIPKWPFYLCYPLSGALFALFAIEKLLGRGETRP